MQYKIFSAIKMKEYAKKCSRKPLFTKIVTTFVGQSS